MWNEIDKIYNWKIFIPTISHEALKTLEITLQELSTDLDPVHNF